MRKVSVLFMLVFAVLLAGCGLGSFSPAVRGSGKVTTESRPVSGFSAVKLKGSGELKIEVSGTDSLSITADDNLLPYLTSEISDNALILGTRDNQNIDPTKQVIYKLTVKDLNSIEVDGSGSAQAKGIRADRLKVVVAGSGNLEAAGTAEEQEITLAGSGEYRGDNVKSKTATIAIYGSGGSVLNASEKLTATIAGSGSIKYIGDPTVSKQILGSGTVEKR